MKKNLLNEIKAMNRIAGTQLTKEQEVALIRERLEQLGEGAARRYKASDIKPGYTIWFIKHWNPDNDITKAYVKSVKGNKIEAVEYATSGWNSDTDYVVDPDWIFKVSKGRVK